MDKVFRVFFLVLFSGISGPGLPGTGLPAQKLPSPPKPPTEPIVEERNQRGDIVNPSTPGKDPATPKNQDFSSAKAEREENPKEGSRTKAYRLRIILCDGRVVSGKWDPGASPSEIQFNHTKEGIRYTKTLPLDSIGMIRIQSWRPVFQKKEKDGDAYRWEPKTIMIQARSGDSFTKEDGLDGMPFSILKIENNNGKASLYSLWIDLLYPNGTWYSRLKPVSPNDNREDCYPDVWREVEFQ